jgi:splicing factor 3B subunit 1
VHRYTDSIDVTDAGDDEDDEGYAQKAKRLASYTAPKEIFGEVVSADDDEVHELPPSYEEGGSWKRIVDREDDYRQRRLDRQLSPERVDAFADGPTASKDARSYGEVIRESGLNRDLQIESDKVSLVGSVSLDRHIYGGTTAEGRGADSIDVTDAGDDDEVIRESGLNREEAEIDCRKIALMEKEAMENEKDARTNGTAALAAIASDNATAASRKRQWDATPAQLSEKSEWDEEDKQSRKTGFLHMLRLAMMLESARPVKRTRASISTAEFSLRIEHEH